MDFAWSLWCQNAHFWRRILLLDLETLHCIIPVSLANCSWQVCLQWKSVSEAGRLLFFLTLSGTAERDRPTASFFSCPNLLPPQISRCLCRGENDLKRWHTFSCCCDGVQSCFSWPCHYVPVGIENKVEDMINNCLVTTIQGLWRVYDELLLLLQQLLLMKTIKIIFVNRNKA